MTDEVQKIRAEIERRIEELQPCNTRENLRAHGAIAGYYQILSFINSMQEEPVSERFAFKAIPRLLEMIEPTDRAKAYTAKLADALEVEGYLTDAKIVRKRLKIMNGEKVVMTTMDEEPVSDDLKEASEKYAYTNWQSDDYHDGAAEGLPFDAIGHTQKTFKAGAKWKEEQFEKKLLKHCDSITNEQAELESGFIDQHLNKHQRMPTFLDAIEYGMQLQKEQMMARAFPVEIDSSRSDGRCILGGNFARFETGDKVKVIVIKEK